MYLLNITDRKGEYNVACSHRKKFLVIVIYPKDLRRIYVDYVDTNEVSEIYYCPSCHKSRMISSNIYIHRESPWYNAELINHK